ncbi:DNA-processing protein DprA [Roseimaritima ulvae]|nr:DNA-processing protein DprA [Roseimaritima ulvae]
MQTQTDRLSTCLTWLRLTMLPGIGPRILTDLLHCFGSPQAVLAGSHAELTSVPGVGSTLANRIRHAEDHVAAQSIIDWCTAHGVDILLRSDPSYPRSLLELGDAPPLLFSQGTIAPGDALAVGIVGTRHATVYGRRQAERIAYGLARAGVTIVSGLARGIDSVAHQAALDAEGRTIAVLGGGLGKLYPPENESLARSVAASGALLSEYRPDAAPRGGMFPQRNRLISGLSMAVVVIEAPDRSGALITARLAAEQGREVLVLPGPVNGRASQGCNQLIRDGATLIRGPEDVLEDLGPAAAAIQTASGHTVRNGSELLLNEQERQVLEAIELQSTAIDAVVVRSGLPVHRVLATISVLESRKLVRRLSGQYVSRI